MSQDNEPHVNLNAPAAPETLYRLRLSVLKDKTGAKDCPSKIFAFPTLSALTSAAALVRSKFGSGMSAYNIAESGVGAQTEDDGSDVEDGRTLALKVEFESASADESWSELKGRLVEVEADWAKDLGA